MKERPKKNLHHQGGTSIHTGEQRYRGHNFRALIESKTVTIIGHDPADIGGLAALKRVAEYADRHGIGDDLIGLSTLVQVSAALPQDHIAFEYPTDQPEW